MIRVWRIVAKLLHAWPLATAEEGLRATEVAAAPIASTRADGAATKVGAA